MFAGPSIESLARLHADPSACGRQAPGTVLADAGRCGIERRAYLRLLTWAFTVFNSVRVLAYLPTVWAIHTSGDSSQHSLWTWLTWLGANMTMAAWLYEHNGQRTNTAVLVNVGNTCMCLATVAVIVAYRV